MNMLAFTFFLLLGADQNIDSLKILFSRKPTFEMAMELNNVYRRKARFDSANALLRAFDRNSKIEEKATILFCIADNDLFNGSLNDARTGYLAAVSRFSDSDIANDALERLYMIETALKDTLRLKRLARYICLYETARFREAADSFKNLLDTEVGEYAYLYTALAYVGEKEHTLALGALSEMTRKYPAHKLHRARLLLARVYIELGNRQEAKKILEALVVKDPNSVYLMEAKELLKEMSNK